MHKQAQPYSHCRRHHIWHALPHMAAPCTQPTCNSQQVTPERVFAVAGLRDAIWHEQALQRRALQRPCRVHQQPEVAGLVGGATDP